MEKNHNKTKASAIYLIKAAPAGILLGLCVGCHGTIQISDTPDGNYKEVQNSEFDVFIVRDDKVFSDYNNIILLPLVLDDMEVREQVKTQISRSWASREESKLLISDYYLKAKSLYYDKRRDEYSFGVVDKAGRGVMAVEFSIKEFWPYVTRDGRTMDSISQPLIANSLGRLHLEIAIVDASSGEFVAYIRDRRHLTTSNMTVLDINKGSQAYIWRSAFSSWFADLDRTIDKLKTMDR